MMKGWREMWIVEENEKWLIKYQMEWKKLVFIFILIFKGYEGKVVIKWVAEKQLKSVTQYNIEKSSFDLDIEVRRGKSSCEIVGGGKTADTIESSGRNKSNQTFIKRFFKKGKIQKGIEEGEEVIVRF